MRFWSFPPQNMGVNLFYLITKKVFWWKFGPEFIQGFDRMWKVRHILCISKLRFAPSAQFFFENIGFFVQKMVRNLKIWAENTLYELLCWVRSQCPCYWHWDRAKMCFFDEIAKMRFENIKILPKKCMLYMSSMVMHFLVLNKDDLS